MHVTAIKEEIWTLALLGLLAMASAPQPGEGDSLSSFLDIEQ